MFCLGKGDEMKNKSGKMCKNDINKMWKKWGGSVKKC